MVKKEDVDEDIKEQEIREIQANIKPKINVDSERDNLIEALQDSPGEIQQLIQYKALGKKQEQGGKLSPEENQFMKDMNSLYNQEKIAEKQVQENQEQEKQKYEEIKKEYEETLKKDPSKILYGSNKEVSLRGGTNLPALLKFNSALKKAKKKGGKLVIKVYRERKVCFEWTNKELTFMVFWTKDEKGNDMQEITRFSEYKYNFEGTPVPVLFAIQGYAEGFDFFDEFRKDITSEMVSRISSRSYHTGYLEGINLRDKQAKKGMFEGLQALMPLILIIGLLGLGVLMYTMYGEMQIMRKSMEALSSQVASMAPIVLQ